MVARELVDAGAREAGRALALLLRRSAVTVSTIEVLDQAALAARLNERSLIVAFTVSGGLPGRFALATTEKHAIKLAAELVGKTDSLNKKALSALTELGNIGASAFLNGVARALESACVPSIPSVIHDEAPAALAQALGSATEVDVARLDAGGTTIELCFAR